MVDFTPPDRNPIKLLTVGYVIALTVIAAMSFCIYLFLNQVIAEQNSSSLIVSARQAKLSQRIALHAGQYVEDPSTLNKQLLEDALELFKASHEALVSSDGKMNVTEAMPDNVREVYFELPYHLDEKVQGFVKEAAALLDSPESKLGRSNPHFKYIMEASAGPLINAMDSAVLAYEADSFGKISRLQSFQRMALFVIFATLIAEAFLIFMPLVRRVTEYAGKLEMLALTDPLTGIDNYRNFMQKGLKEIKRGIRLQKPLCVCILDLDHFKSVNDQHGHNAGDVVLKEFAGVVKKCLRLEDEFGRIGGEEFGILLPHTMLSDAKTVAERIRATVEITTVVCEGKEIYISVSIGVAEANPKVMTLDHVLNAADKALYKAKQKGRNRVEINRDYTTDSNVVVLGKGLGKGPTDS